MSDPVRDRLAAWIDTLARRAGTEISLRAAAHRARLKGKDYRRSLGQLRRWRDARA